MRSKEIMKPYRTTATVVGVVYLVGFVVGIGGDLLIQSSLGAPNYLATLSANSMIVGIGALLWLVAVAGDAAHGVLMFPVLKPHGERLAVGYLAARIIDALVVAIMVIFILLQLPLGSAYLNAAAPDVAYLHALGTLLTEGQFYAYTIAMSTLGASGLLLCYTLYRAKLLPRWLAVWGLVGYATFLAGSLVEIVGLDLQLIHTIPGGLWEVFAGVWLIVKGFNAPASAADAAIPVMNTEKVNLSAA